MKQYHSKIILMEKILNKLIYVMKIIEDKQ